MKTEATGKAAGFGDEGATKRVKKELHQNRGKESPLEFSKGGPACTLILVQ